MTFYNIFKNKLINFFNTIIIMHNGIFLNKPHVSKYNDSLPWTDHFNDEWIDILFAMPPSWYELYISNYSIFHGVSLDQSLRFFLMIALTVLVFSYCIRLSIECLNYSLKNEIQSEQNE